MLTHIVMFKFKENTPEVCQELKARLEALPAQIPQIRYYEVGINSIPSNRSYDMSLISRFDSVDDLGIYNQHPVHVKVVEYVRTIVEKSVVVDYEG